MKFSHGLLWAAFEATFNTFSFILLMCLYRFFQKCGLVLVFLFLFVGWDMLLLKGMKPTATNFRLSEMEWFFPTPKVTHISFPLFLWKINKFSYTLVLISLRYLDDRNMSMRSLNSPTFLPALCHAEADTHVFYWQFLDFNSSSVFSWGSQPSTVFCCIHHTPRTSHRDRCQGLQWGSAFGDQQHNLAPLRLPDASGEKIPPVLEELLCRGK